jgi:multidrug transporter EmrE-like cation transporter
MPFLLAAIACSSSIAIIFRISEGADRDRYVVTTANYVAATLISLILLAVGDGLPAGFNLAAGWSDATGALTSGGRATTLDGAIVWGLLVGLAAGPLFFGAFIAYQLSVRRNGVGTAGAMAKLGILVPMVLALIIWRESLPDLQLIGLLLAAAAVLAVNLPIGRRAPTGGGAATILRPALLALLLLAGLAEFSNKVFERYGPVGADVEWAFLLPTFAVAGLLSAIVTLRRLRRSGRNHAHGPAKIRPGDAALGLLLGVPNVFSSYFLIQALEQPGAPAAAIYPTFGAGTVALVTLVGITVFRERPAARDQLGILLTIAAVILINIG